VFPDCRRTRPIATDRIEGKTEVTNPDTQTVQNHLKYRRPIFRYPESFALNKILHVLHFYNSKNNNIITRINVNKISPVNAHFGAV